MNFIFSGKHLQKMQVPNFHLQTICKYSQNLSNAIHRVKEGTRGERRRGKRKAKGQGKKWFAETAVAFPFQGVLWQTLNDPWLAVLVLMGSHRRLSIQLAHPPGGPGGSAELVPPLLSVKYSCLLCTRKKCNSKRKKWTYCRCLQECM